MGKKVEKSKSLRILQVHKICGISKCYCDARYYTVGISFYFKINFVVIKQPFQYMNAVTLTLLEIGDIITGSTVWTDFF